VDLPELSGPAISEIAPRGKPLVKASNAGIPVGSFSWSLHSRRIPSGTAKAEAGFMLFAFYSPKTALCVQTGLLVNSRYDVVDPARRKLLS
jgi:hypothetical protein